MNSIASMIDHTFLKSDGTAADIARLCREAKKHRFASVCVHPAEVARCTRLLKGSGVKVCTVVGFPLGRNKQGTLLWEACEAIEDGAAELDFVIDVTRIKEVAKRGMKSPAGTKYLAEWLAILGVARTRRKDVVTKLIIECCFLTDSEKAFACRFAKEAGFDFVKTSTGFGTGGATVRDVRLMRRTVGRKMGVKAAGGIRTYADALAMVKAGATRLGCSASVAIVREEAQKQEH